MLASLRGLIVTLGSLFDGLRKPVTAHYPSEHKPIEPRFMGFPALTWDFSANEAYCTSCMVCIRDCPTQCMTAVMKDNPKVATEESHRRKIIDTFEINLNRCILCGICVDVCNLDAIVMSHEHELSTYQRNGDRVNLEQLLEMGKKHQAEEGWQPAAPERNHAATVLAARKERAAQAQKEEGEAQGSAPAPGDGAADPQAEPPAQGEEPQNPDSPEATA